MAVGKAGLGNVLHTVNREYGVLLLGEDPDTAVNVTLKLVEEGLAETTARTSLCSMRKNRQKLPRKVCGVKASRTMSERSPGRWTIPGPRWTSLGGSPCLLWLSMFVMING